MLKQLTTLQLNGISVFASNLNAKEKLFDLDLTEPIGLVIGSEGDGVSPAVLRKVDRQFIIPQKGTTDSLNVSVATGMMLYETMRQRK